MQWRVKLYKLDFLLYVEVGFTIKININIEDATAGAFHSDLLRAVVKINQRLCIVPITELQVFSVPDIFTLFQSLSSCSHTCAARDYRTSEQ